MQEEATVQSGGLGSSVEVIGILNGEVVLCLNGSLRVGSTVINSFLSS